MPNPLPARLPALILTHLIRSESNLLRTYVVEQPESWLNPIGGGCLIPILWRAGTGWKPVPTGGLSWLYVKGRGIRCRQLDMSFKIELRKFYLFLIPWIP